MSVLSILESARAPVLELREQILKFPNLKRIGIDCLTDEVSLEVLGERFPPGVKFNLQELKLDLEGPEQTQRLIPLLEVKIDQFSSAKLSLDNYHPNV